ncbi:MAG: hypothetical protein K9J06_15270 [Flavobacteriales bacterium]|nr:hypothetical protein [Flavobacteriales bacterium]
MGTVPTYAQYALMAETLRYPTADTPKRVREIAAMLEMRYPDAVPAFERFAKWTAETGLHEMEEVYAKTFHVQAICYLDLGYVIFGEDYKRGEFLVNMKNEQAMVGNDCGTELPDNLANMLTLLPLMKDADLRDELAGRIMIPALRKMLAEFTEYRMELRAKMLRKKHNALIMEGQRSGNIYKDVLESLLIMMNHDFTEIALNEYRPGTDPLRADAPVSDCGTCSITHSPLIKTVKP